MITPVANWDNVQANTGAQSLPADGYVCRIINTQITVNSNGAQMLKVAIDIADGDYKDFFRTAYDRNTYAEKKWGAVLTIFLPSGDGSDLDMSNQRRLKTLTEAVEQSTPGYKWDWDETKLSGKLVGMLFRNEEWSYAGKTGWKARPYLPLPVKRVLSGDFTVPDCKPLGTPNAPRNNVQSPDASATAGFTAVDDCELPF